MVPFDLNYVVRLTKNDLIVQYINVIFTQVHNHFFHNSFIFSISFSVSSTAIEIDGEYVIVWAYIYSNFGSMSGVLMMLLLVWA